MLQFKNRNMTSQREYISFPPEEDRPLTKTERIIDEMFGDRFFPFLTRYLDILYPGHINYVNFDPLQREHDRPSNEQNHNQQTHEELKNRFVEATSILRFNHPMLFYEAADGLRTVDNTSNNEVVKVMKFVLMAVKAKILLDKHYHTWAENLIKCLESVGEESLLDEDCIRRFDPFFRRRRR